MIPVIGGIVSALINKGADIIDQTVEDKDQAMKLKHELQMQLTQVAQSEYEAKADIINTEAGSEHKLAAVWRPVLMLVIVAIVANNYILAPYAELLFGVTDLALDLPERMWDLMVVGVGGYIGGRSVEKTMKEYKKLKG